MTGRVYRWRGSYWRVICRWQGKGPRNVLLERVEPLGRVGVSGQAWHATGERVVRPFRGLRRP